jgi:hypothetical protein
LEGEYKGPTGSSWGGERRTTNGAYERVGGSLATAGGAGHCRAAVWDMKSDINVIQ